MLLNFPNKIYAGDFIQWRSQIPEYPSDSFSLSWSIRGNVALDVTATPDQGNYLTTISAVQSETLTPGLYYYQAYLSNPEGRTTIDSGQTQVFPNLSLTSVYDGRSPARQMLDLIQEAIKNILLNGAAKEYRIKEREMTYTDLPDLYALENDLRIRVAREEAANKGMSANKLQVRFW